MANAGGTVMCWDCISKPVAENVVFIEENMTGKMYRDIVENSLLQSARKLKMNIAWTFKHDNDPKHQAAIVTKWLNRNQIERLVWPSTSPDMNPIEHLSDEKTTTKKRPRTARCFDSCLEGYLEGGAEKAGRFSSE
jgi:hypothetical protein